MPYKKNFQDWSLKKEKIDESQSDTQFEEREVWWCALGTNIGFEMDGGRGSYIRPVVVLSKFNLDTCIIIPLTGQIKRGKYYFPVGVIANREATAVLSQLRYIDRRRLEEKILTLEHGLFNSLQKAVVSACFPETLK